ncbi:MAG: hypothetical protein EZS28_050218, partial [Streblomastix strix]
NEDDGNTAVLSLRRVLEDLEFDGIMDAIDCHMFQKLKDVKDCASDFFNSFMRFN